ncbi:MAG: SMP-30/gluconolactonase/LRE family protein [Variibacter sp.]|nr:SMP-30/gluconolactonase/LRE family protein [Variibacter sp.]
MSWTFERVASPFQGPANGIVWDGKAIIFSLMEEMRLMRFDPESGTTSELRKYTNRVNGLAFGPNGELYGCQEGGRRLVEFSPDGRLFAVDALLDGKYHNYPSDLTVDSQGRIWFADPHSQTLAFGPQIFPPLDHASVLRLERNERRAWTLTRITYDTVAPRSVLLSPDEKTLYVAEGEPREGQRRELRAYPIREDGTVGSYTVLHTFGSDHRGPHRGIEGMCLDADGNIVACGGWRRSGPGPLVYVFSPEGAVLETHPVPGDMPNRCCFGHAELDTLYVTTAGGELYRAKTTRRGRARG